MRWTEVCERLAEPWIARDVLLVPEREEVVHRRRLRLRVDGDVPGIERERLVIDDVRDVDERERDVTVALQQRKAEQATNNQKAGDDCEQRGKCPNEHDVYIAVGHTYARQRKQHGIDDRNNGRKNTKPYVLRGAWRAPTPLLADWLCVERRRIVPDRHLMLDIHFS